MCRLLLMFLLIFYGQNGNGQTCCSGGVPLSSNLGLPVSEKGTFQFALTYDLNVLETLKTGRQTLADDSRSRKTHSGIFEIGYSLTNKWSIDGFFSYIRQEREINQFGNSNFSSTNGIGDAVLLLKYKLWSNFENNSTFQIGVGPKIPIGKSDKSNAIGLTFNADLQPGSGAWDGVFFGQFTQVLPFRPSMSFLATTTYGLKGKNKSYFDVQTYQFGNELQISLGLSDRLLISKSIVDASMILQYRIQSPDQIDFENLPSTGGNWIFFNPSIAYWINPNWSFNIGGAIPIYADIEGTQVTPTFRFNSGVFFRIPKKTSEKIKF